MTAEANEDKVYKVNSDIREQINQEIVRNMEKFKDPVVLGVMISQLLNERENTNRLLKTLLARIEALEEKIGQRSSVQASSGEIILPEVDEAIVAFLREGPKSAEDVRAKFGYKGKNAASSRLNRLYNLGVVVKKQVGKKVFFSLA